MDMWLFVFSHYQRPYFRRVLFCSTLFHFCFGFLGDDFSYFTIKHDLAFPSSTSCPRHGHPFSKQHLKAEEIKFLPPPTFPDEPISIVQALWDPDWKATMHLGEI